MKNGAIMYMCHSFKCQDVFQRCILKNDLVIRNQIIWVKDIPSYSNNEYRQQHENIFYCHKEAIEKPIFYGENKTSVWKKEPTPKELYKWWKKNYSKEIKGNSTVWKIKSIQSAGSVDDNGVGWFSGGSKGLNLHTTQKPIDMIQKAIKNSSKQEDIILDTFLGSGSTLIACEKINRTLYGCELDPKYIDVIITRWCEYTGNYNIIKNGEEIVWEK